MSDTDAYGGRKGDGKKRWAERKAKKEARANAAADAAARERAAEHAAAAEKWREQRRAARAAEDAYHRQRQKEFKEASDRTREVAGGATTVWRLQHLQVLGLRADQDMPNAIRRAHKRLALAYHPDKNSTPEAPEMFRRIQAAYEALTAK